jgi:transcriptional regulator with XRE-family HTH domain
VFRMPQDIVFRNFEILSSQKFVITKQNAKSLIMPRKPPHGDYNERELRRQFAGRLLELIDRLYEGKKRDFAKACGISESTITEYTQAKIAPALINLIKIRKATNVSLDWLLCGDESERPLSQEEIAAKYKISPTTVRAYMESLKRREEHPADILNGELSEQVREIADLLAHTHPKRRHVIQHVLGLIRVLAQPRVEEGKTRQAAPLDSAG